MALINTFESSHDFMIPNISFISSFMIPIISFISSFEAKLGTNTSKLSIATFVSTFLPKLPNQEARDSPH